jgi:membrane protease YdiL (CAAX protease family)
MTSEPSLKPIGLIASLCYFGIPGGFFSAILLGVLPWMVREGYHPFLIFNLTFGGALAALLAAALIAYRVEGRSWKWAAFRDRMRLTAPTKTVWAWTLALVVGTFALEYATGFVSELFDGVVFYTAPSEFSEFMSQMQGGTFGLDLAGRWDIVALVAVNLFVFNILGEELWWRGIILPRQELAFGTKAWIVNGVLWDLFHFFYHTSLASVFDYLPLTVPLAFVAQRTRNTWPGIVGHFIGNSFLIIAMAQHALGR